MHNQSLSLHFSNFKNHFLVCANLSSKTLTDISWKFRIQNFEAFICFSWHLLP